MIGGDPGNRITNPKFLPWWVAAATHLVFGVTIAAVYRLGEYTPYVRISEQPDSDKLMKSRNRAYSSLTALVSSPWRFYPTPWCRF